jgi:hypothetical protein
MGKTLNLPTISPQLKRIVELVKDEILLQVGNKVMRSTCNVWDYTSADKFSLVRLYTEEPYVIIPQVRICGGGGE